MCWIEKNCNIDRERERGSKEYGKSDMDFHRIEFALLCSVLALCSLWIFAKQDWLPRWEIYIKCVLVTRVLKKKRDAQKSVVADLEKINKRSDQRNNKQWFRFMLTTTKSSSLLRNLLTSHLIRLGKNPEFCN
jgi:hypothetical protein